MIRIAMFVLVFTGALVVMGDTSYAAQVNLQVKGLRSDVGTVRIALYDNPKAYDEEEGRVEGLDVSVEQATEGVTFQNLTAGNYAIALFHDEDEDNELDKWLFIPTEGYGFSKNIEPGLSKPDFDEVKFAVADDADISLIVTMQY